MRRTQFAPRVTRRAVSAKHSLLLYLVKVSPPVLVSATGVQASISSSLNSIPFQSRSPLVRARKRPLLGPQAAQSKSRQIFLRKGTCLKTISTLW